LINIIFESPDILAVDKPSGYLSIPGRSDDSIPVLKTELEKKYGKLWIVHRLDIETSGVMIWAKNADAHRKLSLLFEKHEIKKTYLCIIQGEPPAPNFKVSEPLEGKKSLTRFEVLSQKSDQGLTWCLLRAQPQTGRFHQIRKHLAHLKLPIMGDTLYGAPKNKLVQRVALHAESLSIPDFGDWKAPLPDDFAGWLSELGLKDPQS